MMRRFVLLFSLLLACVTYGQRLEYFTENATGTGETENLAIEDAIIECVKRHGLAIEAESQLKAVEKISDNESYASESFQRKVNSATRGVVKQYRVVDSKVNAGGLKEVKVEATIVKLRANAGENRYRVAVLPFKVMGNYEISNSRVSTSDISRISTQAFVNRMVGTRKFTMLDREYADYVLQEQATILNANTPIDELCKFGQVLGADYIVVGIVESVNSKNMHVKMNLSNMDAVVNDSGCAVTLRFIDVATRQIKFSEIINTKTKFSAAVDSPEIEIFNQFSEQAIKKVIDDIYPLRVIAVEDDEVVLNQGGEGVIEGDKYEMFAMGDVVKDPYTGESLGRKERKCGEIVIVRVKGKTSDGRILTDSQKVKDIFEKQQIVCRVLKKKEVKKSKKKEELIW